MSNYRPRVEMLRPDTLKVDPEVQRALSEKAVQNIVDNFDEEKLGVPLVSRRADGDYVTDGWTRTTALIRLGKGSQRWAYLVTQSTGQKLEAKRFVSGNTGRRPHPIDVFRINLKAEDPETVAIDSVLAEFDLKIGYNSTTEQGTVSAVSAMTNLYRRGGEDLLRDVLSVIADAWGREPNSHPVNLVIGLGLLLGNEAMDIDRKLLARKLSADGTALRIVGKGRTIASASTKSAPVATSEVILGIYNKGKRIKIRIPA